MLLKSPAKGLGCGNDSITEQPEAKERILLEAMNSIRPLPFGTTQRSSSQVQEPPPGRHCSVNRRESISVVLAKGYATVALGIGVVSLLCGLGVLMAMTSANGPDFSSKSLAEFARVTARPW